METHDHNIPTWKEKQWKDCNWCKGSLQDRLIELCDRRRVEVHRDCIKQQKQGENVNIVAEGFERLLERLPLNLGYIQVTTVIINGPVKQPNEVHLQADFISELNNRLRTKGLYFSQSLGNLPQTAGGMIGTRSLQESIS